MAESNSPAFQPPVNKITDNDPMIVRIPLDVVDIGYRKSQMPADRNQMTVRNLKNGM